MGSTAVGLAAGLEGLAQGLAALGAGLAQGLAGGSSPCGIQFASGTSRVKDKFQFEFSIFVFNFKFLLAKTFAKPHTPRGPFAHTISSSDERRTQCHYLLQHHLRDHYQQMSAMTHQNLFQSVRNGMTTLTLTLKYQSHHYPLREMVKEGWRGGCMIASPIYQPTERWKLTTTPGEYVSISSTFMAEIAKKN